MDITPLGVTLELSPINPKISTLRGEPKGEKESHRQRRPRVQLNTLRLMYASIRIYLHPHNVPRSALRVARTRHRRSPAGEKKHEAKSRTVCQGISKYFVARKERATHNWWKPQRSPTKRTAHFRGSALSQKHKIYRPRDSNFTKLNHDQATAGPPSHTTTHVCSCSPLSPRA